MVFQKILFITHLLEKTYGISLTYSLNFVKHSYEHLYTQVGLLQLLKKTVKQEIHNYTIRINTFVLLFKEAK